MSAASRKRSELWLLVACVLAFPRVASAHRLDEYLQATRLSIACDRIGVEINLTPGAAIAGGVVTAIDRNRDGGISDAEGAAYADEVIRSLELALDGKRRGLTLDKFVVPSVEAMRRGDGVIRLRASVRISVGAGTHRLTLSNAHRRDISVYMANVLVPEDDRIGIKAQSRDMLQREYGVDYTVSSSGRDFSQAAAALPPVLGLALAAALYAFAARVK